MAVFVLTLKYDRQSVHQYGMYLWLASRVLSDPRFGQCRPAGQITSSNHAIARSSVGNMSIN